MKQKKTEYEDTKSEKNSSRLKSNLENIKEVLKVSLNSVNERTRSLEQIEENSRRVSENAKSFHKASKELKWSILMRKYLFYVVLVLMLLVLGYLKFF